MEIDLDWLFIGLGIAVVVGIVLGVYLPNPLSYILGFGAGVAVGLTFIFLGTFLERRK